MVLIFFNFIFIGCVEDITVKHSIVFACQSLIDQALQFDVNQMHVDATFKVVPSMCPSTFNNTCHDRQLCK